MENKNQLKSQTGTSRKSYRSPELSSYGDVSQITRSGSGGSGDSGGTAGMTKQCWIAEALYGVDAPRTQLVRAWLTECYDLHVSWARAVVPLYRRFGQTVAGAVRHSTCVERVFRPVFDYAVQRAHRYYAVRAVTLHQAA